MVQEMFLFPWTRISKGLHNERDFEQKCCVEFYDFEPNINHRWRELPFFFKYILHLSDCCDGSDEYDGSILCPNTCIMGGNVEYKTEEYVSTTTHLHSTKLKEMKIGIKLEDLIQTLAGIERNL
ncbi:hypothetical protein Goklo_008264 [Gossypium klotzschianum]|uniref:Uncharacterized protein n=1 Tax=Gossypium klotzschianum TaxID=34286 RepID=A0A7J8UZL7_9ROSI|nr:hypothetical protein [Gossypium klotzschianum]